MTVGKAHEGKTVRITPQQQLESGFLFFKTGNQYRLAAITCAEKFKDDIFAINNAEDWSIVHDPVCNLLGHAAELYLKAYLIAHGYDLKTLASWKFGHKLEELHSEARSKGMILDATQDQTLKDFSKDYGSPPYILRYPDIGARQLNFFNGLLEMVDAVRSATFSTVNNKARSLGSPLIAPGPP